MIKKHGKNKLTCFSGSGDQTERAAPDRLILRSDEKSRQKDNLQEYADFYSRFDKRYLRKKAMNNCDGCSKLSAKTRERSLTNNSVDHLSADHSTRDMLSTSLAIRNSMNDRKKL